MVHTLKRRVAGVVAAALVAGTVLLPATAQATTTVNVSVGGHTVGIDFPTDPI